MAAQFDGLIWSCILKYMDCNDAFFISKYVWNECFQKNVPLYTGFIIKRLLCDGSRRDAVWYVLMKGVKFGKLDIVKYLLEENNKNEWLVYNALDNSVQYGHQDIVEYIMTTYPPKNEFNNVFNTACLYGHYKIAQLLIPFTKEVNNRDLIAAVNGGNESIVQLLLSLSLKANCFNGLAVITAEKRRHAHIRNLLLNYHIHAPLPNCRDGELLVKAARNGDEEFVIYLLNLPEHAPSANCKDGKALVKAAKYGHENIVRLLLEWPVNAPRANSGGLYIRDHECGQPWRWMCPDGLGLIYAAKNGYENIVRLLLDWPIHPAKANCHGNMALTCAAENGHENIVRILLTWPNHPADANGGDMCFYDYMFPAEDDGGGIAVLIAASNGHKTIVELLLDWPVNAPPVNCIGHLILEYRDLNLLNLAAMNGHESLVCLLLKKYGFQADGKLIIDALRFAIKEGQTNIVRLLLKWPINAPHINDDFLRYAICYGQEHIVQLLLEWQEHGIRATFSYGEALIYATIHSANKINIIKLLLHMPLKKHEIEKALIILESEEDKYFYRETYEVLYKLLMVEMTNYL